MHCIIFLRQLGIMKAKDIKNELFVLANPEKAILQGFSKQERGSTAKATDFGNHCPSIKSPC